ncbi:MAG TPA: glycosyl hydrolase [Gaiellaceae bacterium]|nr:glycosyl hydrolase [Gaiellaceae bacterium]
MTRLARLSALAAAGAFLLAAVGVAAAGPRSAGGRSAVAVPARGAYLGAYVQSSRWTQTARRFAGFEAAIGRRLAIDNQFYGWAEGFPTSVQELDRQAGRISMITWKAPPLDEITSGSQDALIAARADAVRDYGAPLFIRWGWEMNGYWTEWSGIANNSPGRRDGPAKYVRAWRRIHDIFEREGATNVSWVWAPNAESIPNVRWNRIGAYYPGDAYVDWVGLSAYNFGNTRPWSHWSPFSQIVRPVYAAYAARKPIMVAETASTTRGGDESRWIRGVVPALRALFPRIKAVVWFEHPPEWSVRSSARALAAFRTLASAALFEPMP